MIFLDTETIGLTGPVVLIQHARDDGKVNMVHVVSSRFGDLLRLLESFCLDAVCGFNVGTFDWWQLTRLLHLCLYMKDLGELDQACQPVHLARLLSSEFVRRRVAMRPRACLDLMLHARGGPMQSLMERDDVRIRRVPKLLAQDLADCLTDRLLSLLPPIFFAYRKNGCRWEVEQDPDDEDFPGLYLKFGASGGLKPLAKHLLGAETIEFPIPGYLAHDPERWDVRPLFEQEVGGVALGEARAESLVRDHAAFWAKDPVASRYAYQDIDLLRRLWKFWGCPKPGDTNSELSFLIGTCRAVGFPIDRLKAHALFEDALLEMRAAPRAPATVRSRLHSLLTPIQALAVPDTTGETLEAVVKTFTPSHPAGKFADQVAKARTAEKRVDMLLKLLKVRYAAWDYKTVGALTNRMSGSGGNNVTGVEKGKVRGVFQLRQGGDFAGFEPAIAAEVYGDKNLQKALTEGKKLHTLFGVAMYDLPYSDVGASDKKDKNAVPIPGKGWDGDVYNPSKHGVLAWLYGAETKKISETLRMPEDETAAGVERFFADYPQLKAGRKRDQDAFCSMIQPGGLGTRVIWREPADKVESLFGWPRFFTLENAICKVLFNLGQDVPQTLKRYDSCGIKVHRREGRSQVPGGAVASALYGAAFQMQARNMRAAGNHRIQATGAHITKELELACWQHQPVGIADLMVLPWNVHDEVDEALGLVDLTSTAAATVERFRKVVPLLKMTWQTGLETWEDLK